MTPTLAAIVGAVLSLAVIALVLVLVRSGRELGRVAVRSAEPFSMTVDCSGTKVLTIWCDVELAFTAAPNLRGPLHLVASGGEIWRADFDLGRRGGTTAGGARIQKFWFMDGSSLRGVTRVAKLATPRASAVTLEGTIQAGPGTTIQRLELFVAGR